MKKLIRAKPLAGKRGTNVAPLRERHSFIATQFSPQLIGAMAEWADKQSDAPNVSEAVRRLVEIALTPRKVRKITANQKNRAKDLAGIAIDELSDAHTTMEEKATRKLRLLKGPEEFRGLRMDALAKSNQPK